MCSFTPALLVCACSHSVLPLLSPGSFGLLPPPPPLVVRVARVLPPRCSFFLVCPLLVCCCAPFGLSAFLDLAFDLVDLVLWGRVWTPSYGRPFKLWFEFEVHLDQFFARQGWGQRSKNLLILLDELTETGVYVHTLQFLNFFFLFSSSSFSKILLSMEVALPFFLFLHTTHGFRG